MNIFYNIDIYLLEKYLSVISNLWSNKQIPTAEN